MSPPADERRIRGERLYALALRLYPRAFREAHAEEMLRFYRELGASAAASGHGFVRRMLLDLIRSLPAEHLRAREQRRGREPIARRRRPSMLASLLEDSRFALRTFARAPLFTLAALATMAIGIGATTTMFGVVDRVLLRPLPYPGEGALIQVGLRFGEITASSTSPASYQEISERSRTLAAVAVARMEPMDLAGDGTPERIEAAGVSHRFFEVLGTRPALGRTFMPADDGRGAEAIVVLSHALWQRRFGGDPGVLGRVLILNGSPWVVAGVMPREFRGPQALYQQDVDLWFPLGRIADALDDRTSAFLQMVVRAKPDVTQAQVEAELLAIGEALAVEWPGFGAGTFWAEDLRNRTVGDVGQLLWILLGAVALLLVIASANVANLFLVRATERTREMAVRSAIGAGRGRIVQQLLTESVLLAVAGGLLGVLLAMGGVSLFRALAPAGLPRIAEVAVDARVLGFALAVSALTGVVFGLAPVFSATRSDLAGRLREASAGSGGRAHGHRVRSAFVVLQTAFALVLLTGAALLLNAFVRVSKVDPGFRTAGIVWLEVDLPSRNYPDPAARLPVFEQLLEQVRGIPGVRSAGAIHGMPLSQNGSIMSILPEGHVPEDPEQPPRVAFVSVMPGYFETLDVRLVDGRAITEADASTSMQVVVVTEAFVRRFWPGESAVGKQIRRGESVMFTVVGVAADHRHAQLTRPPEAMIYLPLAQFPRAWVTMVAQHEGEASAVLTAMRQAVWSLDDSLPLGRAGTARDLVSRSLVQQRFRTVLVVAFAAIALVLTFVGLYGTMAHLVRARRREMGIRLALGAAGRDVRRLVIARGMLITGLGLALGCAAALAATRVLTAFLFEVTATDPATFTAGIAFLATVGLLACWIPARRAAAVDPAQTLRSE
jgi:putative ABC transport system permease protein